MEYVVLFGEPLRSDATLIALSLYGGSGHRTNSQYGCRHDIHFSRRCVRYQFILK